MRTPLVFRDFDSIKDRNNKAAATMQKTKYFIERKCAEVLDARQALVTEIRNLKGEDIPELEELYFGKLKGEETLRQLKVNPNEKLETTRLWILFKFIKKLQLYSRVPIATKPVNIW